MANPSDLPLSLYKANTEFQLRVNKLVMENWKKWLELSTRAMDDGIAEQQARVEQLIKAQDWAALASMPADTFWRQLQQRMGDGLEQRANTRHRSLLPKLTFFHFCHLLMCQQVAN